MKLVVGPIYTFVEADFVETQTMHRFLVAPDEEGVEYPLFDNNRFYTGLLGRVEDILRSQSFDYELEYEFDPRRTDPRTIELPTDYLSGIELRPHQHAAAVKLIANGGRGVINMATGGGKTEIGCAVAKYFGTKTLFVNDRIVAMAQSYSRFKKYGIDVGRLGGGYRELDHQVVTAVVDSLYTGINNGDSDIQNLLRETDFLLFDEVHHLTSNMWTTVGENCRAPRRAGLSASAFSDPDERFFEDMQLIGQTGDVVCYVTARWLIDHDYLAEPLIHFVPITTSRVQGMEWHSVYDQGIVQNSYRNYLIAGAAEHMQRLGFKILILIQRIEHGKILLRLLNDPNIVFSFGGGSVCRFVNGEIEEDQIDPESIRQSFEHQTSGILIGSTVYDEAIDIPSMNVLIMAGGGKSFRRTIQRIGRPLHSKADFVHVFDFWDYQHPYLQKHSRQRSAIYHKMEYQQFRGFDELNRRIQLPVDPGRIIMEKSRRR